MSGAGPRHGGGGGRNRGYNQQYGAQPNHQFPQAPQSRMLVDQWQPQSSAPPPTHSRQGSCDDEYNVQWTLPRALDRPASNASTTAIMPRSAPPPPAVAAGFTPNMRPPAFPPATNPVLLYPPGGAQMYTAPNGIVEMRIQGGAAQQVPQQQAHYTMVQPQQMWTQVRPVAAPYVPVNQMQQYQMNGQFPQQMVHQPTTFYQPGAAAQQPNAYYVPQPQYQAMSPGPSGYGAAGMAPQPQYGLPDGMPTPTGTPIPASVYGSNANPIYPGMSVAHGGAPPDPPQTVKAAETRRHKHVLQIVDPDTQKVTNEDEYKQAQEAKAEECQLSVNGSHTMPPQPQSRPPPDRVSPRSTASADAVYAEAAAGNDAERAWRATSEPTAEHVSPPDSSTSPLPPSVDDHAAAVTAAPAADVNGVAELPPVAALRNDRNDIYRVVAELAIPASPLDKGAPAAVETSAGQPCSLAAVADSGDFVFGFDGSSAGAADASADVPVASAAVPPVCSVEASGVTEELGSVRLADEPPSDVAPASSSPAPAEIKDIVEETDGNAEEPKPDAVDEQLVKLQDEIRQSWTEAAGMWSPENPDGSKVYGRRLMMALQMLGQHTGQTNEKLKDRIAKGDVSAEVFETRRQRPDVRQGDGFQSRNSMFNLPWQQQPGRGPPQFRPSYSGRRSQGGDRRGDRRDDRRGPPQPVINIRPTAAADVVLRKAANPWKPALVAAATDAGGAADAPVDDEVERKKIVKRMRGILNRITPNSMADLLPEFLAIPMDSDAIRGDVVALLFEKAVDEPDFCAIYSEMANNRVQAELATSGTNKSAFRNQIVLRCQKTFEQADSSKKAAADFASIADKDERAKAKAEHDVAVSKERRLVFGNIRFIGELFKFSLLVVSIFHYCMVYLLQRAGAVPTAAKEGQPNMPKTVDDEEAIESAIRLMEGIAPIIAQEGQKAQKTAAASRATPEDVTKLASYMAIIRGIRHVCSNRVAFAVDDLVEQSQNNWVKRRKTEGPKTIAAIHRDAALEKMQSEEKQKQWQQQGRYGDRGGQRGGVPERNSYGGRQSQERRNLPPTGQQAQMGRPQVQGDKHRAFTASQTAGTNPTNAKLPSLSRHTADVKLGPSGGQTGWHRGAGTPAAASSGFKAPSGPAPGRSGATRHNRSRDGRQEQKGGESSGSSSREPSQSRTEPTAADERQKALQLTRDIVTVRAASEQAAAEVASPPSSAADTPQTSEATSRVSSPDAPVVEQPPPAGAVSRCANPDVELKDAVMLYRQGEEKGTCVDKMKAALAGQDDPDNLLLKCFDHFFDTGDSLRKSFNEAVGYCYSQDKQLGVQLIAAFGAFMAQAVEEDMGCDMPLIWQYAGQLCAHVLLANAGSVALADLRVVFQNADCYGKDVFAHTLLVLKKSSEDVDVDEAERQRRRQRIGALWTDARPALGEIVAGLDDAAQLASFFAKHAALQWLQDCDSNHVPSEGSAPPPVDLSGVDADMLELERQLQDWANSNSDETLHWLDERFPDGAKSGKFIECLGKAICSNLIGSDECPAELNQTALEHPLLQKLVAKYIAGEKKNECLLLDACALAVEQRHFPQDLLATIQGELLERASISAESFVEWYDGQDEGMITCDGKMRDFVGKLRRAPDDHAPVFDGN